MSSDESAFLGTQTRLHTAGACSLDPTASVRGCTVRIPPIPPPVLSGARCDGPACKEPAGWLRGAELSSTLRVARIRGLKWDVSNHRELAPRDRAWTNSHSKAGLRSNHQRESTPQHGTPADQTPSDAYPQHPMEPTVTVAASDVNRRGRPECRGAAVESKKKVRGCYWKCFCRRALGVLLCTPCHVLDASPSAATRHKCRYARPDHQQMTHPKTHV